jgi:hypothetical protein
VSEVIQSPDRPSQQRLRNALARGGLTVPTFEERLPFCSECATRRWSRGELPIFCQSFADVTPGPEHDPEALAALSDADLLERLERALESVL